MLYYFPHPSNLRLQREVIAMRRKEGPAGYGIYVMILELLRDSEDQKVYDDPDTISFALHEDDVSMISRVCHDYSLFRLTDDGYIISPFLLMCQQQADMRKAQAREWGKAGAKARYSRSDGPQSFPSPAQDPQEPGQQPTPEHHAHAYRVPIPPPMGTLCVEPKEPKETKRKEPANQPTKSKLVELEWLGIPGMEWLNLCRSKDIVSLDFVHQLLSRKSEPGHNNILLIDWIRQFGMSESLFRQLEICTNFWTIDHPAFKALLAVLKHVRNTKYTPQHPSEFLISTAIKFYRDDA